MGLSPHTVQRSQRDVRSLLVALGLGNYSAQAAIPFAFMLASTTDPQSPSVVVLIKAIQNNIGVPVTGVLDMPTNETLKKIVGVDWQTMTWAEIAKSVLHARATVPRFYASTDRKIPQSFRFDEVLDPGFIPAKPQALSGITDFLPDVPGGILTYALGGYLLYRAYKKSKGA